MLFCGVCNISTLRAILSLPCFVVLIERVVWKLLGEIRGMSGLSSSRSVWVGNSPSAITFPGNAS